MGGAPFHLRTGEPKDTPKPGAVLPMTLDSIGQGDLGQPLQTRVFRMSLHDYGFGIGGEGGTRTPDPVIMSHVL